MARIAGVDIPREKRLEISLTYIFGVGLPTSQKICAELELELSDSSTDVTAESAEGTTPLHQVALRSHVVLPRDFGFDGTLAWVDELDTGNIDDYVRLDLRLSWRPMENLELSLVGQNLADPHQEFGDGLLTQATKVPRGVYGGIRWLGW